MTYTTFDTVSERLGGQLGAATRTFIDAKIAAACSAIDRWCGQSFAPAADTASARTFRARSAAVCKTDPFSSGDGLIVEAATRGVYTTIDPAAVELDRFGGAMADVLAAPYDAIITPGYFVRGGRVRVTAKWGWATVPAAVSEAAEILTVELWARKDTPFGVMQTAPEFAGLRIGRDVMAQAASLLHDLRRFDRVSGIA